ncbi:DNA-binding response OmpR family regulator [Desulfitispora alkaliphila]|uniref:response regulator n=1 Tax=Desulfitispora alkaliphila TaxID=622674 RepID=UPI003D2202B2
MSEGKKILIVDDEPKIIKVIEQTLITQGYQVIKAEDGEKALEQIELEQPDLMVLDLMLPKLDGYEVCRMARKKYSIPIIMLTAKADLVDKAVGFNMGVDDYVTKPFSPSELALRIKAVLRRVNEAQIFNKNEEDTKLILGEVSIDYSTRLVTVRGNEVTLTAKEFELLGLLMKNKNQVFTREQLLQKIWDSDYVGDINTVTVLIRRIREKIELDPANPKYVITVWGVGYKFSNS